MSLKSTIHPLLQRSFALLLALSAACSADPAIDGPETPPEGAVLCLSTNASITRADGYDNYDEDPYSQGEDLINRVDLFFFHDAEPDSEPFYVCELTGVQKNVSANLTVKVPVDKISEFTGSTAYVYALVNLPDGQTANPVTVDAAAATIAGQPVTLGGLKEVWVIEDSFTRPGVPSQFVMYGGNEITLEREGRLVWAKGTIPLERLASKIRLWVDIPDELYLDVNGKAHTKLDTESDADWEARKRRDAKEVWRSVPTTTQGGVTTSNVKLYITNLASRGRIDGATGTYEDRDGDEGFLRYRSVTRNESDEASVRLLTEGVALKEASSMDPRFAPYTYTHQTAYYSYPNVWDSQRPSEQHQTYLILALPWERTDGLFQNCYYQVPVNALRDSRDDAAADCLDPNRYYRIKLRIGMLGSKDLGDPLEVDASCEAVAWQTEEVDVSVKERRYLVVNQTEWTMNNISSLTVPFSSSHEVEVAECYVTYFRYNDIWGKDIDNTNDDEKHNDPEFDDWLEIAATAGVKETEGKISQADLYWGETGKKLDQTTLYYKKDYFYDQYYAEDSDLKANGNGGFKYYVGHEHPKTFQEEYIARPKNLSGDAKTRWDEYQSIYGMDAVYSYHLDNQNQQITIDHPLVWWKEAYSDVDKYYYVPETKNGRLRSEYSRCEITIKLRHLDRPAEEHLFEQTIHITQYPGLYIEVSHDYGNPVPTSGSTEKGNQYVLVNGHTTEADRLEDAWTWFNSTNWNEVSSYMYYFGFINNNPNMYVIHTTQLEEDMDGIYILGDPRNLYYNNQLGIDKRYEKTEDNSMVYSDNVENPSGAWNQLYYSYIYPFGWRFGRAETIRSDVTRLYDGSTGPLRYYYPTDETEGAGSKESFVAPVFRIASSFGKVSLSNSYGQNLLGTNYLDRESRREARRRCAAYQEAGRPAGRWRVPTISEIEYVMQLSADNKIPHLFGLIDQSNSLYWCSTGLLSIDLVGINDPTDLRTSRERITKRDGTYDIPQRNAPAVRCVYDEWYWNQVDGGEFPVDPSTGKRLSPTTREFYWGDRPKDNPQTPDQP